ncbi:MAG: PP2C family protein-serine/threonine phosphatase [Acetatifactor sp.]
MRRINSDFQTLHISEEGQKLSNRDYFGYVEMDDFACYVLADSLDDEPVVNSARLVVDSIIRDFTEAPTMGKGALRRYLHRSHAELLRQKAGMHLKVAVVMAVTDYRKLRYCHVGNSRLYLIRNARILEQTKDQSLTRNLLEQDRILLDEAARHEERNNLYSFLGERGKPEIQISRKKKLEAGDLFIQLTRGVWEQCGEQEILQIVNDAKETKDILDQVEDRILKEQNSRSIDNYSMAVTSVNKVYQSPQKPISLKKILLIVLPVLLTAITVGIMLFLRHRSIQNKTQFLRQCMESGEEYFACNNFPKAVEEYGKAKELANSLNKDQEYREADLHTKLAEQVIMADEALSGDEYQKAQELYLVARQMSVDGGNIGLSYIEEQLDRTEGYIEVFDLIAQGERKEEYGNLEGAITLYKEAKEQAAKLYFMDGKKEALELQIAAEEKLEKEQLEKEKRLQEQIEAEVVSQALDNEQKLNDQQNAINMENQGNELLAQGSYESAITFYRAAQASYKQLGLTELAEGIDKKIEAAKAGIAAREAQAAVTANTQVSE